MKKQEVETTIPGEVLVNPHLLAAHLASKCNSVFSGSKAHAIALAEKIMDASVPEVRALERTGYDSASNTYVMSHFAIPPDGKLINLNQEGFFDLGGGRFVQPFKRPTAIKPHIGANPAQIAALLYLAWGVRAAVALAWVISAWFVNQIKKIIAFHPFLSLHGDTQCGKSALTRILNAIQCLDEEGLSTRKTNTSKGEIRKLTQYSGLFAAILEFVPGNSRFDLDQILTAYNTAPLQVRAQTTNDNRIHEIPFYGSLMFVANREPLNSKAQKERAVSLGFKADQLTPATAKAFIQLDTIPSNELAGFFVQVMAKRKEFEDSWYDEYQACIKEMRENLNISARLIETHSLVWAFHRIFCRLFSIQNDLGPFLFEIASQKHRICANRDETPADFFFGLLDEIKDDLDSVAGFFKTDKAKGLIAINLNGAIERIQKDHGTQIYFASIEKLQQSLREHPAFITCKQIWFHGQDGQKTQKRAWIFDIGRLINE